MTLQSYQLNTIYQKTELQYEAKLTALEKDSIEDNSPKDDFDEIDINAPVIYTNPDTLTDPQKFQKLLLENILGGFTLNNLPQALFPNEKIDVNKESYEQKNNPYAQNSNSLPQGFLYEASSEYYEKTSFEFSFEAIIKTPKGEYNIEINFSYTREFYEKNETQIAYANENFVKNPFEIELDEDNENLKDLKSLHFIFDVYNDNKEDKKDIFEQLKELLAQRRELFLEMFKKDDSEDKKIPTRILDNFQIWQENSNHEMSLVAAKKDNIGIFLANSSSESNFMNLNIGENGYSFEAGYSTSKTTISHVTQEINE